jgi:zinc protease
MINRAEAPAFAEIENIRLGEPLTVILDNNIPLYVINEGTQDLVKIEFIFFAGKWFEKNKAVSAAVNSLLTEGTRTHSAAQIADMIDFYGAFVETENTGDTATLTLYCLNKHLEKVLPVIKEILAESVFPENELQIYAQNHKQKLIVNNERVDYIARKLFNEVLYGNHHPYGYYVNPEDYDNLQRADLEEFFNEYYKTEDCRIVVSGKVDDHTTKLINHFFGVNDWNKPLDFESRQFTASSPEQKVHFVAREGALQSAIRIGRRLVTRKHPDYIPMQVVNTILGGYFGSRLMTNIREDKGYTYGIGSGAGSMLHEGYFLIATEVGVNVCNSALDEIYKEIDRLRTEPVSKDELGLVKNYMLGSFLRGIDGPFELAEKFKNVLLFGLDYGYYQQYIHTVRSITPEEIQVLANRYLQRESLYEMVVGGR